MLHHCPHCKAAYGAFAAGYKIAGTVEYTCVHCGGKQTSVEVPEPYLRELVMNSLELKRLQALAVQ